MTRWFTSDIHFGHENIIDFCNRPFGSLNEMHNQIINIWNMVVKPEDDVWVLGDISFLRYKDFWPIATALQGRKFLVKGNHDVYSYKQYRDAGFADVFEQVHMRVAGVDAIMSHYPYFPHNPDEGYEATELRYQERRPPNYGKWLLHGHTHSKDRRTGRMIHVGMDAWNYTLVSESTIEALINRPIVDSEVDSDPV